jgi:hypothetical protein
VEGEKRIALPSSLFLEVLDRADGKIWGSIDNSDKDYYVLWLCWNETDPSWDRPILGQSWYLKLKNCIDVEYHGGWDTPWGDGMSYKYSVSLTEQNLSVDVTMANQVPRKLNRMVDTIESL